MIQLEKISKIYPLGSENKVEAVVDVSLEVAQGEFLVITGRSGSGKTTLLNLIAGLTKPTAGQVRFDGADLWSLSDSKLSLLRNQKIGCIFQFPSLLPSLTTLENVSLPTIFSMNHTQVDAQTRATELLDMLGMKVKLNAYPRQLSAGQQQRVVIARALLNHPEVLLADEPTSDLDEQTEIEIMDLFKKVHEETGVTIILVTHASQLVSYGTRSIKMAEGKIVSE
jgi:ABC-type lipoprotein export system ATPase subunit